MYKDLKKIYHADPEKAEAVYKARLEDPSVNMVGLREELPFFYWMPTDVLSRILEAERLDRKAEKITASMPSPAIDHYITECMIDEIVLTNEIEGVVSTRLEVKDALDSLRRNDRRHRFQGIVKKYAALAYRESTPLESIEDVRALYDELVLEEALVADPSKGPDGRMFRKNPVQVIDAAQRVKHMSTLSEMAIESELGKALASSRNIAIEPLVRAAVLHFAFAFIHPFYDGNGRMNRFISSDLISREFSMFAGLRLSYSVKENINAYYNSFTLAEHPLNRGDLTPFIITFLDMVVDSLRKTCEALEDKGALLFSYRERLAAAEGFKEHDMDEEVGRVLIEAALFTSNGLTADEIGQEADISIPTFYKRLKPFAEAGLVLRLKHGRKIYHKMNLENL